jgi:hypothetical protein
MTTKVPASSETNAAQVVFSGEVWTDARGFATVALPRAAGSLHAGFAYELRPFTAGVTAHIAAELSDGRFTIATDEPHVKVGWRVTGRRLHSNTPSDPRKEER